MEPSQLEVIHHSCTKVQFRWKFSPPARCRRLVFRLRSNDGKLDISRIMKRSDTTAYFDIVAGQRYKATVYAFNTDDAEDQSLSMLLCEYGFTHAGVGQSISKLFKAVYSQDELGKLMTKASTWLKRTGKAWQRCACFYRDKPPEYFSYVNGPRRGIMEAYLKDNHGDPANPINDQLHGLFFNATMDRTTSKPPAVSIFGSRRVSILPNNLLTGDTNMYFSDFYCVTTAHYIQIVLTENGSREDEFCRSHLWKLNKYTNPFLFMDTLRNETFVCSASGLWVEVFYAGNVNTRIVGGVWSHVPSRGMSRPGGLAKNAKCRVCNL